MAISLQRIIRSTSFVFATVLLEDDLAKVPSSICKFTLKSIYYSFVCYLIVWIRYLKNRVSCVLNEGMVIFDTLVVVTYWLTVFSRSRKQSNIVTSRFPDSSV